MSAIFGCLAHAITPTLWKRVVTSLLTHDQSPSAIPGSGLGAVSGHFCLSTKHDTVINMLSWNESDRNATERHILLLVQQWFWNPLIQSMMPTFDDKMPTLRIAINIQRPGSRQNAVFLVHYGLTWTLVMTNGVDPLVILQSPWLNGDKIENLFT